MATLTSRLRLRHFRLVQAIAETGQISTAATQLAVSQPAASRTLAEIERIIGEPLFERHAKGMRPTLIGEVIMRHAATLVGDLDRIAVEVDAFRRGTAGVVRIGAVTGAAVGFVVPAVQKLKSMARLATVSIDIAPSVDLIDRLMRGELDIALCRLPQNADARPFLIRAGRVEQVRFLVRSGHPLIGLSGLTLDELAGFRWVIQACGMPVREAVDQAFANRGLPIPGDTIDTSSLMVALAYLKDTDAIAAITQEVYELLVPNDSSNWAVLDMKESLILSPYQLIRKRDRPMTPVCESFVQLLEAELTKV